MRRLGTAGALVALCGAASTVIAQDSVGVNAGDYGAVLGDAPRSHDLATQCTAFVLDLGELTSSWGNTWGVGPLAKSSNVNDPLFYNSLMSNQSLSQTDFVVDASGTDYADWSEPGDGVVPLFGPAMMERGNSPAPRTVPGPATSRQLAYMFSEFGGPLQAQNSAVVGGFINWDPTNNPGRLYVTRTQAAVNNQVLNTTGSADIGVGMVDADGNAIFRADSFGVTGPNSIGGNDIYRVRIADRNCGQINWINSNLAAPNYDAGATDRIVNDYFQAIAVPNVLPESLATSGNGRFMSSTFNGPELYYENTTTTAITVNPYLNIATDDRGAIDVAPYTFTGLGGVATAAILSKPADNAPYGAAVVENSNDDTLGISVWGVNGDGSIATIAKPLVLPWALSTGPGSITDTSPSGDDPNTGVDFVISSPGLNAATPSEFGHTTGQTSFRGPTSQVSVGTAPGGEALVSAVLYNRPLGGNSINPGNTLVVARADFSTDPPTYQWTAAAWTNFDQTGNGTEGKAIVDGPGSTNAIARIVPNEIVTVNDLRGLGGGPGPAISPAGFDSEGNLYFVAPVQIKRGADFDDLTCNLPDFPPCPASPPDPFLPDDSPNPERDRYEFALIRGNLTSTVQDFYYELELVMATGDVYTSPDTGLDYQVQFISITNLGGGFAAQAFDSGNVTDAEGEASSLGGLIIEATITYDVDGLDTVNVANPNPNAGGDPGLNCPGGFFDYPVELGGSGPFEDVSDDDICGNALFPNSSDQSYRVLMFVGREPSILGACCVGVECIPAVTSDQCVALGGTYQGDASDCALVECGDPTGACCWACNGGSVVVCQELSNADCCLAGGVYAGDGVSCASTPCSRANGRCQADMNGDGITNVFDFSPIFTGGFNSCPPAVCTRCNGDFNCDGAVDVNDFSVFLADFGCSGISVPNQCCAP